MPSLSTSHYRRAVQPGVVGTGVVKAADLDYNDNLETADVALLRTQLLEAGIDWLDSVSYSDPNRTLTFHFVSGRQHSFYLPGSPATPVLYVGGSMTAVASLTQADLDALTEVENPSSGQYGFVQPVGVGATDAWIAYFILSTPNTITHLEEGGSGTPTTPTPASWIPTPPSIAIGPVQYNVYANQRTGFDAFNVRIVIA